MSADRASWVWSEDRRASPEDRRASPEDRRASRNNRLAILLGGAIFVTKLSISRFQSCKAVSKYYANRGRLLYD